MQAAQHIAQQFSVLAVPTRRRGTSRFSLYLLEHGELFLYDFGGILEGDDSTARGRLRCCSRSLVFEPADARAPPVASRYAYPRYCTTRILVP